MSRTATLSITALILAGSLYGQVLTQPGSGGGTPPASNQSGNKPPQQTLGGELPFFDPGSETVSWDGKLWNINDNRLFSARFEKYLAAPEAITTEDQEYRKLIDTILSELSPTRPSGPNLAGGVALLPEAAQYHIDARLCDSLANAIWGVWLSQKNAMRLNAANEAMRKRMDQLRWNYEIGSKGSALQPAQKEAEDEGSTAEKGAASFGRVAGYIKDQAELEAKMTANKGEIVISKAQAKIEFQALLIQFFLQRRFEHVVMGTRFYRNQFQDGDGTLQFKEGSDVSNTFASGLGFEPTVATLDTFANEAIRDVDEGVRAFEVMLERGDLESATKRLSEAFVVGEYLPRVRRVPLKQKLEILEFVRYSNRLLAALESKNFGAAEETLAKIKEVANDFDDSKAQAAIQSQKVLAASFLNEARNAAITNDRETMKQALAQSLQVWPNNPAIAEFMDAMAQQGNFQAQATADFKRLLETGDLHKIAANKNRFLLGVQGEGLDEKLISVAERAKDITKVIETSRALENENPSAAWEVVRRAKEEFGDDPQLNNRLLETIDKLRVISKFLSLTTDF